MAKIMFKSENSETIVEAKAGDSLLEAANDAGVNIFGGCGGAGVCGTCHVYIEPEFMDKLNEPSTDELDTLDVLQNGKSNSRLACQVIISDDLDGMMVTIP